MRGELTLSLTLTLTFPPSASTHRPGPPNPDPNPNPDPDPNLVHQLRALVALGLEGREGVVTLRPPDMLPEHLGTNEGQG